MQVVVYLAKQKLKHQTMKVYLSALCQIAQRQGDPFLPGPYPHFEYVLKGVNSLHAVRLYIGVRGTISLRGAPI